MKNYPKITAAIVLVFVLVVSIMVKQLVPLFVNNEGQTSSSQISSIATEQTVSHIAEEEEEMRAVWVPFMSLTMSSENDKSEADFQKKFDKIVKTSKEKGKVPTITWHKHPCISAWQIREKHAIVFMVIKAIVCYSLGGINYT